MRFNSKRAWRQIKFLLVLRNWLSRCNQNKKKQLFHIDLIWCIQYYYYWQFPSFSAFHLCLSSSLLFYSCSLIETMPRKFQGFGECRFGGSEKDRYFLKNPKWQHKIIQEYKRRKLASYFLDNAAKTYSYGLKISKNIEI